MSVAVFDPFRAELCALKEKLKDIDKKTLRDEALLDRIRTLFRSWVTTVKPSIEPHVQGKRDFLKLHSELEVLAALTAKQKRIVEYRRRVQRAIQLANGLVLFVPAIGASAVVKGGRRNVPRDGLFLPGIPDLPLNLVPNAILGWRSEIDQFLARFSFDKSVFIMIRYRKRNEELLADIKTTLGDLGYHGIVAADHRLTDDLYNPIACLLCCARGLAVFDAPETQQAFNPNVAYELGMMHLLGRDCRILKHSSLKVLHTDILMKLYLPYSSRAGARDHLRGWLENHTT